jgi:hypothetical protein
MICAGRRRYPRTKNVGTLLGYLATQGTRVVVCWDTLNATKRHSVHPNKLIVVAVVAAVVFAVVSSGGMRHWSGVRWGRW